MNLLFAHRLGKFVAVFSVCLLAASLGWGANTNTALVAVQISPFSNYGLVYPNYNGQQLVISNKYSMTAYAKPNFTFTNWTLSNSITGFQTNSRNTKLTFVMTNGCTLTANFLDKQKPLLSITALTNNTVTSPNLIITGLAGDNDAVANVFCSLISPGATNPVTAHTGNNWNNWWVNLNLTPGTNTLLAYAQDRSGNTNKPTNLKLIFSTAPNTLAGKTITVAAEDYFASFTSSTNGTFSQADGVGTYTYNKSGPLAGKLSLRYTAPPSAVTNDTVFLQFYSPTNGIFSDAGDFTNSFTLATAANLVPTLLNGANLVLAQNNDTNQSLFVFLNPPNVSNVNSNAIATSNPLVIPLTTAYPGAIGDRVQVTFNHQHSLSGTWYTVAPVAFTGTVIDIGSGTNTVTILFDIAAYNNHSDVYAPVPNIPLNILTFYYTNYTDGLEVASGAGTYNYTNFSPVGGLLQVKQDGTNTYYVLTFTNATGSGNYYAETAGVAGSVAGSFDAVIPPTIITQPKSLQLTNEGGPAIFTASATGTPPLTYQWQFNGSDLSDLPSQISGSQSNRLTISGTTTNDVGSYHVIVTNSFGTATSSDAALTLVFPPKISTPPANANVTNGATANFYVAATGTPPLNFQWQFKGTNLNNGPTGWGSTISGALSTNLTITTVTTNDFGTYQVTVKNNYGSVTTNATLGLLP